MPGYSRRTYAGFKRKRAGLGVRPFKRRRISVRRRNTSYNTKSGAARSFFFRKRRLSGRTFRRIIYRNSQFTTHYRSIGSTSGSLASPVGSTTANTSFVNALDNGAATFWTTTGGALSPDTGVSVPLFKGDITLRGGIIGVRVYNDGAYPMHLKIWLVWTKDSFATNSANYTLSGVPIGWDPTTVPDFARDLTFIKSWSFNIEQLNMITVEHKLRPTKIDQLRFATDVTRPFWLFSVSDGDTAGQDNARVVSYFNVSFSADAIGTT